jgi:hypothetical protein
VSIGKESLGIAVQIIELGPEMIIDYIEIDHHVALVSGSQEPLEVFGTAVTRIGSMEQDAVITPVVPAGDIIDRHQLDGSDAEIAKVIEPVLYSRVRSFVGERTDMQFVDDRF